MCHHHLLAVNVSVTSHAVDQSAKGTADELKTMELKIIKTKTKTKVEIFYATDVVVCSIACSDCHWGRRPDNDQR